MRKGSKEAKAWGEKMRRLRNGTKKRKYTTRKRRTTRKGDLTLEGKRAYSSVKRRIKRRVKRVNDAWNF
jgi:hypothetical protein